MVDNLELSRLERVRRRFAPSVRVRVLTINAPRKAYLGLLVDRAQVAAIVSVARARRVGIVIVQECYPGQRRAWRRRRGWDLVEASPNDPTGRGNVIAVCRRYGTVLATDELVGQGPGDQLLHFPTAQVAIEPRTRRLRRLQARGYWLPALDVAGCHFPRKPLQEWRERVELARVLKRGVMHGRGPAIVAGDTNDRRLFVKLGGRWLVRAGIDGVAFSSHFSRHRGRRLGGVLARVSDHGGGVLASARLKLSRP